MARINLLPWRIERRKQRERAFYASLGLSALTGALVLALLIGWMVTRIHHQEDRNKLLAEKIAVLDEKIVQIKDLDRERSRLLTRKQIIEELQANRSQMVHLFDELVRTIPDGVRLASLKQTGDQMNLDGVAQSNSRVATYMRNLDASQWMGHAELIKIENKGAKAESSRTPYEFSLRVKLRKPEEIPSDELENASAPPAATAEAAAGGTTAGPSSPATSDNAASATVVTTPEDTDSTSVKSAEAGSAKATPAPPATDNGGTP